MPHAVAALVEAARAATVHEVLMAMFVAMFAGMVMLAAMGVMMVMAAVAVFCVV